MGEVALHKLKEHPDTLVIVVDILAGNDIFAIKRFNQTAFIDDALAFSLA